jgi:hypothetical protein
VEVEVIKWAIYVMINVDLVGLTLIVGLRMWFGRIEYGLNLRFWLL